MFNISQKSLYDRVSSHVKLARFGGDCYSYGLLASGYIDLVIEADMKVYDLMALVPVIESAGGIISDWKGCKVFKSNWDGSVIAAASEKLHNQAIRLLKE